MKIHVLIKWRFGRVSSSQVSPFQSLKKKKSTEKYYNKHISTQDNGNVQTHDQEDSKLNSNIIVSSGAYALTGDKIIKSSFNKSNKPTFQTNEILTKILLLGPVE